MHDKHTVGIAAIFRGLGGHPHVLRYASNPRVQSFLFVPTVFGTASREKKKRKKGERVQGKEDGQGRRTRKGKRKRKKEKGKRKKERGERKKEKGKKREKGKGKKGKGKGEKGKGKRENGKRIREKGKGKKKKRKKEKRKTSFCPAKLSSHKYASPCHSHSHANQWAPAKDKDESTILTLPVQSLRFSLTVLPIFQSLVYKRKVSELKTVGGSS